MTILVTGFEPFDGLAVNPSGEIVAALARRPAADRRTKLVTEILPCEFRAAGERIVALIREHRPDAILSVGLAASTPHIRLERVALNLNDSTRPDNGGDLARGRLIDPDGPVGYWSTLPLDAMLGALTDRDIPSAISNHAGAYVCNHVFYTARREVERLGRDIPCGFVHVPLLVEQADSEQAGLPLATLLSAVETCLSVLGGVAAPTPTPASIGAS